MATWLPMFALPNIEVRRPIEVDGFALASIHDARVRELAEAHPNFREFLNRVTTEFGRPIIPSVFICRDDVPITYRGIDAIAGFRDAVAMSVIPQSWAKVLRFGNNMGIKYSDYFTVYPWMLDKNFDHLITSTLNMLGWHGNPIDGHRLIVAPAKRSLHYYAPLLYRMALAAFIDLQYTPSPKRDDETEYEAYLRNHHVFEGDIEVALSSIMYTADEFRAGVHRRA
jgi:hypothetical protein